MSATVQPENGKLHKNQVLLVVLGIREKFRGDTLVKDLIKKEIPFSRVDGFDANESRIPESWKNKKRSHFMLGRNLIDGEIACSWGHMRALQIGFIEGREWTLVIEDNVSPINIYEIYESLASMVIRDPTLISFFRAHEFNFPTRNRVVSNSMILRNALSIPTGTKCYAVNRSGVTRLMNLYDRYGFQGYSADFPLFYGNNISIKLCQTFPILLNNSDSLVGVREYLVKRSKFHRIYSPEWGSIFSWLKSENVDFITFLRFTLFRTLARRLNQT